LRIYEKLPIPMSTWSKISQAKIEMESVKNRFSHQYMTVTSDEGVADYGAETGWQDH
jgi:hypothetical protein